MLTFRVDTQGFWPLRRKTLELLERGTERAVRVGLDEGADYARRNHKHTRRTGRLTGERELRGEFRQSSPAGAFGFLVNTTPYARIIESGSKPHLIRPLNYHWGKRPQRPTSRVTGKRVRGVAAGAGRGMALRFMVGGQVMFRRLVRHPGTKALPFMRPASTFAGVVIIRETRNVTFRLVASLWD